MYKKKNKNKLDIIDGKHGYNFLVQIDNGVPIFKKISWDFEREQKNINEIPIEGTKKDRIGKWKRKCNNPYCARGFQQLFFNGQKFSNLVNKEDLLIEKTLEIAYSFKGRILIEGGHFIPEISNFDFVPEQPMVALKNALFFIKKLNKNGKQADLLFFINDLKMGDGRELSKINRDDYFEEFTLPGPVKKIILDFQKNYRFNIFVTSEKKLSLKLNREKRKLKKLGKLRKDEEKNEYFISKKINGIEKLVVINNSHDNQLSGFIKCLGATSRVIKFAQELGYNNFIQIYPVCATEGTELSYEISKYLYDINMNVLNFYTTVTCFSDAKRIKYLKPIKNIYIKN